MSNDRTGDWISIPSLARRAVLGGSASRLGLAAVLAAASLTGWVWADAAQAQQVAPAAVAAATTGAGEATNEGIAEIVVTATKRSESVMKIPVAVSAFSGDTLDKMGVSGAQALQMATPSVVYTNTGAYAQPYIRGVGSRLLQNGFDPSVATYIDGRYIARQSAINFEFADIDRVEVLKGPQGVLFGRNSSAGAIRIITKDVSKDFEGFLKGGYGNFQRWELQGALNIPLTETLGVRISGDTLHHDGYAKNLIPTARHDWDDRNYNSIRARIKWDPTDWFDAHLSGSYWKSNDISGNDVIQVGRLDLSTGIRLGGITGTNRGQVASQDSNPIRKREYATELDLGFHFGWADLTSTTTYSNLDNSLGFEGDGTSAKVVDAVVAEKSKTFSQELQLASDKTGTIEWLAGLYYFRDSTDFDTAFDRSAAVPAAPIASNGQQDVVTKSVAAFGQVKWKITDALSVTGGARYTRDKKNLDLVRSVYPGAITVPAVPYSDNATFKKFTPSATLEYDFGKTLVYAKYARGFKSGGFNYPAGPAVPVVRPEVLDMYEVGLKGNFFDRKLRAVLSGYYYDYKNLQVTRAAASGVSPIVTTTNAANAKLYGLDADLSWYATPQLTLTGSISIEHSKYENYLANAKVYKGLLPGTLGQAGMVDVGFDASGDGLLRAPKFSAFASVNYDIPVGKGKVPINISYAYKGSYLFDFVYDPAGITSLGTTGVLKQNGYGLVNGRIGYEPDSGRWSISGWVNNLFDKKYFDDVVAAGTGIRASYGAPRTYGFDIRYNF